MNWSEFLKNEAISNYTIFSGLASYSVCFPAQVLSSNAYGVIITLTQLETASFFSGGGWHCQKNLSWDNIFNHGSANPSAIAARFFPVASLTFGLIYIVDGFRPTVGVRKYWNRFIQAFCDRISSCLRICSTNRLVSPPANSSCLRLPTKTNNSFALLTAVCAEIRFTIKKPKTMLLVALVRWEDNGCFFSPLEGVNRANIIPRKVLPTLSESIPQCIGLLREWGHHPNCLWFVGSAKVIALLK